MIIFSNTTPIIALSSIGQLDLMPQLFTKVYIVDTVVNECAKGGKIIVPDVMRLDWLQCVESKNYAHNSLLISLDDGEKHTIEAALAHQASYTVIDEKLGRNLAEFLGLNVIGTLGILLKAKQQNKIPSFIACVKAIQMQGIRYNNQLVERLAIQIGEID
jgi:predicted nucleic acid-binding protein